MTLSEVFTEQMLLPFLARRGNMQQHKIVSHADWLVAREAHFVREKELTRLNDKLAAERRELPWVRVEKDYVFDGPQGKRTLADLFGTNSQLVIYHFMFGPDWQEGCPGCSYLADHIDGANLHLKHHDVSVVIVSRAPWSKIAPFKQRMGWQFDWVSSNGSEFNFDYHVSFTDAEKARGKAYYNYKIRDYMADEMPGISVFFKDDDGTIYHTYSSYARGGDILLGANNYLDLTPKGRNESETMDWVRHHDRYETAPQQHACCSSTTNGATDHQHQPKGTAE
jgi:predicted dithiol-disulfide oxidoreductase (DUF899 family)